MSDQIVYDLHRRNALTTTYQTKNKADAAAARSGGRVVRRIVQHGVRAAMPKKISRPSFSSGAEMSRLVRALSELR